MTHFMIGDSNARARLVAGLLDLAVFLETRHDVPVPRIGITLGVYVQPGTADDIARALLDQYAAVIGVPLVDESGDGGHMTVTQSFGPVDYQLCHIPDRSRAEHRARHSYADNVQPDVPDDESAAA